MKCLILLLLCLLSCHSHIYSSDSRVTYDYDGNPMIYHIYLALETGLGDSDYIKILWPTAIHVTNQKENMRAKLISFSNNLQIVEVPFQEDPDDVSAIYNVKFGVALAPKKWYQIQILPTLDPSPAGGLPYHGLIQIQAVSSLQTNCIIYDTNMAFGYISIASPSVTTGMSVTTVRQSQRAAAIHTVTIDISPQNNHENGGNFTLSIHYDSSDTTNHNIAQGSTGDLDFKFMGLCQSIDPGSGTAKILNYCEISDDLTQIYFSVNQITGSEVIRIQTQVSNPLFQSTRGIRAHFVDFISGIVIQSGYQAVSLTVQPMTINDLGKERVYLLWGIDTDQIGTDAQLNQLNLGLYKASSGATLGPFNSFNIGFSFSQTSPIDGHYIVKVTLEATGFLQGSLAHNLPTYGSKTVYCYYQNPDLICKNVGPFIKTSHRYFISGKAYYDNSVSGPITTFGDIVIEPVVINSQGITVSVTLYTPFSSGDSINLQVSEQFLDINSNGYHDQGTRSIGVAQVVSHFDDGTLSSTANAMKDFMSGTNSTIGIVPDLGVSQQLLFLMKVNSITASGGTGNDFHTRILYNNKAIGFQVGYQQKGLDFVGYSQGDDEWSIEYAPCHISGNVVCQKFNVDDPDKNKQDRVNSDQDKNFYGLYKFQCGSAYIASPSCYSGCDTACNLFTGYGNIDYQSSVVSMRKVTFDSTQFHSSLYADDSLLDFVVVFLQGSTFATSSLINAYTMVGTKMQNIKASYVNYFQDTSGNINKGTRIPTMIRIGGGILPKQSRNATVIGVFFDDNMDASSFYTHIDQSYEVGCSTGNCKYYPTTGLSIDVNNIWHTMKRVQFYDIPPIQNQFNMLVPVTPHSNRNTSDPVPDTLTIAFFTEDHSIEDVTGLLKTVSVYRLFGPVVTDSISGSLGPINGMAKHTSTIDSNFDAQYKTYGSSFSYFLNTDNINQNPPDNVFTRGYGGTITVNNQYGAGVTLTSLYYNIFQSSTLAFQSPPANTATTCTIFGYVYNQNGANLQRNGQYIYTVFCPVDSTWNMNSYDANIHFYNPQYPYIFTKGFPLQSVLTSAVSDANGKLLAYRHDTGNINTFIRSCTTSKLHPYNPTSTGKQRATFTVSTPQIRMSQSGYDGYSSIKVKITLPVSTTSLVMQNQCQISDSDLSCTALGGSSAITITISYVGEGVMTLTYFQLQLYAKTTGSLGTQGDYTLQIFLPQYSTTSSSDVPFGDSYTYDTDYCICTSTFKIGTTPYQTSMNFQLVQFLSNVPGVKSPIQFNFGSLSYRQAFFDTSQLQFNFGFLNNLVDAADTNQNFKCLVYENDNDVLTLSSKWSQISFAGLPTVILTPKYTIDEPASYLFTMKCIGAGVPTGPTGNPMTLKWVDNSQDVQTASSISIPGSITGSISGSFTTAPTIHEKRFSNEGMKSFYTFTLRSDTDLDQNSRIYFDFNFNLNSKLDNQGQVQCYIRKALIDPPVFSYCDFTFDNQLSIWNNIVIENTASFFIDIFNIDQPKNGDTSPNIITVSLDLDSDYENGVHAQHQFPDIPPNSALINSIQITHTQVNTTYIRSSQRILIQFTLSNPVASTDHLYLLLPAAYAQWINRDQVIQHTDDTCYLQNVGSAGTNIVGGCTFISKRLLKINLPSGAAAADHKLIVNGIFSPSSIPSGKFNQYRFKLFTAPADQSVVSSYSFTDHSKHLTLKTDSQLIDLSWKYHQVSIQKSLVTLTDISEETFIIYVGYYSNYIELRQSIYPLNYKAQIVLDLNQFSLVDDILIKQGPTVKLGIKNAYFRFAAKSSSTDIYAGLFTFQFTTTGDINNQYTQVPPLTVVVSNKKCQLETQDMSYALPLGGYTLPIKISAITCIPVTDISIDLAFDNSQVTLDTDLSSTVLDSNSVDGQLYFVAKHTSRGALVLGDSVTVTFTISGTQSASYQVIPSITLTIVDSAAYQTLPSATALSYPTLSYNKATFTLQCSMSSKIYWGLGIYPSILNSQALDFQARIISEQNGLLTNFTEPQDLYMRVYGMNYVSTTQTFSKNLYNLKSNSQYIFKYYCINQMGLISDGQSLTFTSLNYGAYLMKVTITFRGSITYQQYHDLSCSLAENFKIPYNRILTEAMSSCGVTNTIFYPSTTSIIEKDANSNSQYAYNFYILPDYSIPIDSTNSDIRSALSLSSTSTSIITSTDNFIDLPETIQMQSQDIQFFTTPTFSISEPLSGLNSVVVSATISNMNGFVIIGCMDGTFDSGSMTLPTVTNIKKGLLQENKSLLQVKMIYAIQNYNVKFSFSGLKDNKEYTFFYFATGEDPSLTAQSTSVSRFNAKTLEALTVNINWQFAITKLFWLVLCLFGIMAII